MRGRGIERRNLYVRERMKSREGEREREEEGDRDPIADLLCKC